MSVKRTPVMASPARSAATTHLLLLLGLCCCPAVAFSAGTGSDPQRRLSPAAAAVAAESPPFSQQRQRRAPSSLLRPSFLRIRGGQQGPGPLTDDSPIEPRHTDKRWEDDKVDNEAIDPRSPSGGGGGDEKKEAAGMAAALAPVASALRAFGSAYSSYLTTNPILTKSVTASAIFGLSDFTAQRIENSSKEASRRETDWTRTITSMLVGLLYFGPAAHAWYETIFRVLPGTSLISTLQKAALGQLLFGPSFTCVFFATSLMQAGTFTFGSWISKIKSDLPGAWAAGLGFWPFVDLVSYSLIPSRWIPLFVNFCSFVWTIYLSMVANRTAADKK